MAAKSIKIEPSWEDTTEIQVKYDEQGNIIKEAIPGKEMIFKCEICERRFHFKNVLKWHVAEMHSDAIITDSDDNNEIENQIEPETDSVEDEKLLKQTSGVLPQKRTRSESSSQEDDEIFNNENKRQKTISPNEAENTSERKIVNTKKKCPICGKNVQIIMQARKDFGFQTLAKDFCEEHNENILKDKENSISCELCKFEFKKEPGDKCNNMVKKWRYHMYSNHLKSKIHKAFGNLISSKCCNLGNCESKLFSDSNQLIEHLIGKEHGIFELCMKHELNNQKNVTSIESDEEEPVQDESNKDGLVQNESDKEEFAQDESSVDDQDESYEEEVVQEESNEDEVTKKSDSISSEENRMVHKLTDEEREEMLQEKLLQQLQDLQRRKQEAQKQKSQEHLTVSFNQF